MRPPLFIGFAGRKHSGQTTAANYVAQTYDHLHLSINDILRLEARDRDLTEDPETLMRLRLELDQRYVSAAGVVIRGIERWHEDRAEYVGGLILSGITTKPEAQTIKDRGLLAFIDASREVRKKRDTTYDPKSSPKNIHSLLQRMAEQDRLDDHGFIGPYASELAAVEEMAHVKITNDGSERQLERQIQLVINNFR